MRADELLWRYQQGERNFKGLDLQGLSLRSRDLSGADFSGTDIRGTDFSNAKLRGVKFTHAKVGLPLFQAGVLLFLLVALGVVLGVATRQVGSLAQLQFRANSFEEITAQLIGLIVLIGFSTLSLRNGLATGFTVFLFAFIVSGIVAFMAPAAVPIGAAIAIAITISSFVTVATALAVLVAGTAMLAYNGFAAIAVGIAFTIAFFYNTPVKELSDFVVMTVTTTMMLCVYIGWRALDGDDKHLMIRLVATGLANRWGTNFRGADLTNADLSKVKLKSTNFDDAILTRARCNERVGAQISLI